MMRRLLLALAAVAVFAPATAGARDWGGGFNPGMQADGQQAKKGPGQPLRGGGRESLRDERRPRDGRHQGRMTDEERRELHKDLDRAHREIYKPAPPR